MKKTIYIGYVLLLSCLAMGCEENWLKPKPLSIFVPENVYVDRAGMESVLLVLRRGLRDEFYGNKSGLCLEIASSDIGHLNGEQSSEIHNFNTSLTPTSGGDADIIFGYWQNAYGHIRNANVVLARVESIELDSEEKNQVLAEALFHRAYWYYRLVHQFGDVPFINKEYSAPKLDFFSHSRNTILDKIQEDLEFSVQWLPEAVAPGMINRAAGNHLLTKVYLANHEFEKAIASASAVIDGGKYRLMTERFGSVAGNDAFNVVWDLHQVENKSIATNTEGILIVQDKFGYPGAQTDGTNTMRNLTPFWAHASYIRDPSGGQGMRSGNFDPQILRYGRGVGYVRPNNYFQYSIWINAGADLRHASDTNWLPTEKFLYNNPNSSYFGEPVQIEFTNPYDTTRVWYGWQYYKLFVANESSVGTPVGGNGDWYLFRLAETYLLRAEAYCWLSDFGKAADDINKIRERSDAPLITATDASIEYVLDERARELYYEEPRKTELTRIAFIMAEKNLRGYSMDNFHEHNYWFDRVNELGYYNKGLRYGTNEWVISPYHVLWPIQQIAIDANTGGRINQNKGYQGAANNVAPLTEITTTQ
jgi:hypothetical protein